MQVEIKYDEPKFNPIYLNITIESKDELQDLILRTLLPTKKINEYIREAYNCYKELKHDTTIMLHNNLKQIWDNRGY